MRKDKIKNEDVKSGDGTFSQMGEDDEGLMGSVKTEDAPGDDEDEGPVQKEPPVDEDNLELEMNQLTEGDFRWSFVPIGSADALQDDAEFTMQQSDLSAKVKEILGSRCPHEQVRY